jgi:hypothetical protein
MITHSTPLTTPMPVTREAPTLNSLPQAASGESSRKQPPAAAVAFHVPSPPAGAGQGELLLVGGERGEQCGAVLPVGVAADVHRGAEDGHGDTW